MKKWVLWIAIGCLLMLAGCGQEEDKEEVFATLEEAIEAHIAEDPAEGAEAEEIVQTEDTSIVLFSVDRIQSVDAEGQMDIFDEPTIYFALFEETEDGFAFRNMTQRYGLGTWGHIAVTDETGWVGQENASGADFVLTARGFGEAEPTEMELEEGEKIYERQGLYFAVKMEVYDA